MEPAIKKRIKKAHDELNALGVESNFNRARSVTVGTAFGGVSEICMRSSNGEFIYALLQPVEVIEIIHQLAASVGCHIQLAPRRDFSSWREWKLVENAQGGNHPPHPDDLAPYAQVGITASEPDAQAGLLEEVNQSYGETLAVEAPKQRRRTKRSAASA